MAYAVKAIIQHFFNVDHLELWLTFKHPMDVSLMPLYTVWSLECDEAPIDIIAGEWLDAYTLFLTSDTVASEPDKVTLEFLGPDQNLTTSWGKQWEPWGPILSLSGWPTTFKAGMIILWSGSVSAIPYGWRLCDGSEGTPDLRDKFIIGAGSTYNPADTGGNITHTHTATQPAHTHGQPPGLGTQAGINISTTLTTAQPAITVQSTNHLPPYFALAYIMKL